MAAAGPIEVYGQFATAVPGTFLLLSDAPVSG